MATRKKKPTGEELDGGEIAEVVLEGIPSGPRDGTEKSLAVVAEVAPFEMVKEQMDDWFKARDYLRELVASRMKEGEHYNTIKGKKSIGFGGAQWLANLPMHKFGMSYEVDPDAMRALNIEVGAGVAVKVTLTNQQGVVVAQGGGARMLSDDRGPLAQNKCLKMAIKSAYNHAVVMATGLADTFTYDMQEMQAEAQRQAPPQKAAPQKAAPAPEPVAPPSDEPLPDVFPFPGWKPAFDELFAHEAFKEEGPEHIQSVYADWLMDVSHRNAKDWLRAAYRLTLQIKQRGQAQPQLPEVFRVYMAKNDITVDMLTGGKK